MTLGIHGLDSLQRRDTAGIPEPRCLLEWKTFWGFQHLPGEENWVRQGVKTREPDMKQDLHGLSQTHSVPELTSSCPWGLGVPAALAVCACSPPCSYSRLSKDWPAVAVTFPTPFSQSEISQECLPFKSAPPASSAGITCELVSTAPSPATPKLLKKHLHLPKISEKLVHQFETCCPIGHKTGHETQGGTAADLAPEALQPGITTPAPPPTNIPAD